MATQSNTPVRDFVVAMREAFGHVEYRAESNGVVKQSPGFVSTDHLKECNADFREFE